MRNGWQNTVGVGGACDHGESQSSAREAAGARLLSLTRSSDPQNSRLPRTRRRSFEASFFTSTSRNKRPRVLLLPTLRWTTCPSNPTGKLQPQGLVPGKGGTWAPFRVCLSLAPNAALLPTNTVTNLQKRGAKSALIPRCQENPSLSWVWFPGLTPHSPTLVPTASWVRWAGSLLSLEMTLTADMTPSSRIYWSSSSPQLGTPMNSSLRLPPGTHPSTLHTWAPWLGTVSG